MAKKSGSSKKKGDKSQDRLKALVDLMEAENLSELEVSEGSFQVRLVRTPSAPLASAYAAPAAPPRPSGPAKEPEPSGSDPAKVIKSPIAGVFYSSPSPSSPPFVSTGDAIGNGQVLCIIEAMKVMNEITADKAGKVKRIHVENGNPVVAGQVLITLE